MTQPRPPKINLAAALYEATMKVDSLASSVTTLTELFAEDRKNAQRRRTRDHWVIALVTLSMTCGVAGNAYAIYQLNQGRDERLAQNYKVCQDLNTLKSFNRELLAAAARPQPTPPGLTPAERAQFEARIAEQNKRTAEFIAKVKAGTVAIECVK